jgi:hypothetical protein
MWKKFRLFNVLKQLNLPFVFVSILKPVERTPTGNFSIHIRLGTGTSPTRLQKKIEHIAVGMKMEEAVLERVKRNRFKIVFRNKSENTFPEYPKQQNQMNQEIKKLKIMSIPFGRNADGYQVALPIFTENGGTVSLIGGLQGQGKSSALKLLVSGLAETDDCIIWFDAKSGADALSYTWRVNTYTDPINPVPYLETLKSIYNSILVRNRLLSSGLKFELLPRIVLLIDEWYLLSAIGEKTFQSDIQTYLRRIVAVGRSANVSVILATQRPTSQNIDVTTRELCNTRIAFYCGDIHASEAILGQSGAEDKTNPLRQGEALVWINGHLERTTLFQVPNPLENSGFNYSNRLVTLEEVKEKENNLCQKYGIS